MLKKHFCFGSTCCQHMKRGMKQIRNSFFPRVLLQQKDNNNLQLWLVVVDFPMSHKKMAGKIKEIYHRTTNSWLKKEKVWLGMKRKTTSRIERKRLFVTDKKSLIWKAVTRTYSTRLFSPPPESKCTGTTPFSVGGLD
jgi:hypothetical protein